MRATVNSAVAARERDSVSLPNVFYRGFGKRALDLIIVIPALLVAAPIMAVVAILIRIRLGRPVIFRQARAGLHGEPFMICKFRTMLDLSDDYGNPLPDGARLTPLGRWLRGTSLDELPTLFQVITGKVSLVGPRPLYSKYLPLYSPKQARRHDVKPGITGWSQVNGRNRISWEERFERDVWYVENLSFWLDLRVIALTFWRVLRRDGINEAGNDTMSEFKGSRSTPQDAASGA